MIRPISVTFPFLLAVSAAFAPATSAQQPKPAGSNTPTSGTAGTSTPAPTNGSPGLAGSTRNSPLSNSPGLSGQSRPIFLMGTVMFDDGTPPNNDIRIERICNGSSSHTETHTDSKGRFSFQVGSEQNISISDADSSNSSFGGNANGFGSTTSGLGGSNNFNSASLQGCELRAAYPGYVSETVDLSSHHSLDDPKVGTILLHRLGQVKGTTLSLTSALAPKAALKNYEKGLALAQKGKYEEAEPHFASATADYPKYAEAWVALGQIQQHLNQNAAAAKSFLAAAAADTHYVSPYDQLARLSAIQQNWQDAANYSKQVIDLNPFEFPSSFWYNAISNYNLKNMPAAEKSARALLKVDSRHRYPEAETMLAEITANRGELDEAATHLKSYLALSPDAKNADVIKRQLAQIEAARTTRARNTPTPAPPVP